MRLFNKTLLTVVATMLLPVLAWAGPVNVNTADAETIARELTGIGHAKALAIVAYRETHGAFASLDELLRVKGIGPSVIAKNRDNIRLAVEKK